MSAPAHDQPATYTTPSHHDPLNLFRSGHYPSANLFFSDMHAQEFHWGRGYQVPSLELNTPWGVYRLTSASARARRCWRCLWVDRSRMRLPAPVAAAVAPSTA
jgi:hypothetical protein